MSEKMTIDELIEAIRPVDEGIEPNCYETDREEDWHVFGVQEGLEEAIKVIETNRPALEAALIPPTGDVGALLDDLLDHMKERPEQFGMETDTQQDTVMGLVGHYASVIRVVAGQLQARITELEAGPTGETCETCRHQKLFSELNPPDGPGYYTINECPHFPEAEHDDGKHCIANCKHWTPPTGDVGADLEAVVRLFVGFQPKDSELADFDDAVMRVTAAVGALIAENERLKPTGDYRTVIDHIEEVIRTYWEHTAVPPGTSIDPQRALDEIYGLRAAVGALESDLHFATMDVGQCKHMRERVERDRDEDVALLRELVPPLERTIEATPTGDTRNALCDLNIRTRKRIADEEADDDRIEIIKAYLVEHGYSGLVGDECGCHLEDLVACGGDPTDCVPGYACEMEPCRFPDEYFGECVVNQEHHDAGTCPKEADDATE